jgi:hypothetical protein
MEIKVTYKGKEIALDVPDTKLEELIAQQVPKRTGYERAKHGDSYYLYSPSAYANCGENTYKIQESGDVYDNLHYAKANYTTDRDLAESNARADTLLQQIRRFAAEHGGIPSAKDWNDQTIWEWTIAYIKGDLCADLHTPVRTCGSKGAIRFAGAIYFLSEQSCNDAIKEFHDDLLWYFTEYDPQLR